VTTLAELLPPRARARLAALQGEIDDCRSLLAALAGQNAGRTLMIAQTAVAASDPRAPGHGRLVEEVEAATRAVATIDAQRAARTQALHRAEALLQPIGPWSEQFRFGPVGAGPIFEDADVIPDRREGEDWSQAVDRVRAAMTQVRTEAMIIEQAPPPLALAKQQITAEVERMAARGGPRLEVVRGGGFASAKVLWPGDRGEEDNLSEWAMAAWLHKQALTDFLLAQAEEMIGDRGIPPAERGPRIAALRMALQGVGYRLPWGCDLVHEWPDGFVVRGRWEHTHHLDGPKRQRRVK
jgi:hypothetical protein